MCINENQIINSSKFLQPAENFQKKIARNFLTSKNPEFFFTIFPARFFSKKLHSVIFKLYLQFSQFTMNAKCNVFMYVPILQLLLLYPEIRANYRLFFTTKYHKIISRTLFYFGQTAEFWWSKIKKWCTLKNKMCKEELLKERQKTTIFSSFCDIDVFLQK